MARNGICWAASDGTELTSRKNPWSPAIVPAPPKASAKPDRPVTDRRDREVREDLRDPRAGVLRTREADLQEGKTRLHEHHEHARHDHPGGVQAETVFGRVGPSWAAATAGRARATRTPGRAVLQEPPAHMRVPPHPPGPKPRGRSYGTLARLRRRCKRVFRHRSKISAAFFSRWSKGRRSGPGPRSQVSGLDRWANLFANSGPVSKDIGLRGRMIFCDGHAADSSRRLVPAGRDTERAHARRVERRCSGRPRIARARPSRRCGRRCPRACIWCRAFASGWRTPACLWRSRSGSTIRRSTWRGT